MSVLQDLCPRCGAEVSDHARVCPSCGFDPAMHSVPGARPHGRGIFLEPMALAALSLGALTMLVLALAAGMRLGSSSARVDVAATRAPSPRTAVILPVGGRILFAERLGDALELESYREQFTRDDTIAWRAEFVEPPRTAEVTLVITWVSVRERMQLTETTVAVGDAELRMIGSEEVPLADLVPTAGMYEVAYYDGEEKLAVGVFELLPPTP